MLGFEPRISGDHSTHSVEITALAVSLRHQNKKEDQENQE